MGGQALPDGGPGRASRTGQGVLIRADGGGGEATTLVKGIVQRIELGHRRGLKGPPTSLVLMEEGEWNAGALPGFSTIQSFGIASLLDGEGEHVAGAAPSYRGWN